MLLFGRVVKVIKVGRFWRTRAAQAALEFLLNYGWAILGVLVVLGGLARFGVLSPSNLLPEKCSFPGSVGCPDFEVGSNGIRLVLQNRAGKDIVVSGVGFGSDALSQQSSGCSTGAMSAVVKNGEKATFYANDPINCAFKETGRPKNKYNVTVAYSFLGSPGISHSLSGELLAKKGEGAVSGGAGEHGGGSSDPALVGYWKFEEGTGNTAFDSSPYGNNGNISGAMFTNDGITGSALDFDGSNDWVNVSNEAMFDFSGNFSVSAWIKPDVAPTQQLGLVTKWGADNSDKSFALQTFVNRNIDWHLVSSSGSNEITSPNNGIEAGKWYHLAGTLKGTTSSLYVNGVLVGTKVFAGAHNTGRNTVQIGQFQTSSTGFAGIIDEVSVWNRSLSAQEIAGLAAQ